MTLPNLDCKPSCHIDLIEAKRVIQQIQLDAAKTPRERNRLGQFATPNALAVEILNYAKTLLPTDEEILFLDPAIGTGSFYSALLQSFPVEQIKSAIGYEVDQDYAEVARKLWANTSLVLKTADFTKSVPPQNAHLRSNLLMCNPPYVRHHHLSMDQKVALKKLGIKTTGIELSGLAGLYCYFLLAAHGWMAPNGLACWLIPSEVMDVNYGGKIKQYLLNQVTLLRVHRFASDELQFADALVSTSVIWLRNIKPIHDYSIEFTNGSSISYPSSSTKIASTALKKIPKWTSTSISSTQNISIHSSARLSDLFEIKRGVATGANDFFIITPKQINELDIPSEFLTPILPSPRYLPEDEIFSDAQGNPRLERQLFLLTCKQPMEYLQVKHPAVWEYFQKGKNIGISERYLCRHRSLWYLQETRTPAMFLCPYMGRHKSKHGKPFRFILNHSKAIAPNVYLMMYPKAPLETLVSNNPELIKSVWKALNSIPIQSLIHEGRVYGDGLYKLEPKELANAPAHLLLEVLENL
jgi:adenine-specific DNA-methyltransferase